MGLADFLNDVREEGVLEALEFVPAIIPVAFVFILSIYYIRNWTFKNSFLKKYIDKIPENLTSQESQFQYFLGEHVVLPAS